VTRQPEVGRRRQRYGCQGREGTDDFRVHYSDTTSLCDSLHGRLNLRGNDAFCVIENVGGS